MNFEGWEAGEVTDEGDRAARLAELDRQVALHSRYEPPADPQARAVDGTVICCDCDTPIAPARLAAVPGAVRCFDCQTEDDRLNASLQRRYGGTL